MERCAPDSAHADFPPQVTRHLGTSHAQRKCPSRAVGGPPLAQPQKRVTYLSFGWKGGSSRCQPCSCFVLSDQTGFNRPEMAT
jgi:hypothetical protein